MEITVKQEVTPEDLAHQLWLERSSEEEILELIKELEAWPEDWGFTFKIRSHIMRLCSKYEFKKEDEYLCEECNEFIFKHDPKHHESCSHYEEK